eukprot:scaffold91117_cov63-Phaeocystis_antarctica.AAC.5
MEGTHRFFPSVGVTGLPRTHLLYGLLPTPYIGSACPSSRHEVSRSMLIGITYSRQQSSRGPLFAKAWCPTHSSSTARARAGAGNREWLAGDHGSQARTKSSQASIPGSSAESGGDTPAAVHAA